MPWFQKLCRNAGLALHNVAKPIKDDKKPKPKRRVTKHETHEEKIDENITLRRTTIEEIEMKPGADKSKLKDIQQGNEADPNS